MTRIKVLHVTWSADKAGLLRDVLRAQRRDPSLDFDVCFGTRGNGLFEQEMGAMGIHPIYLGMGSRYSPLGNLRGGLRLSRIIKKGNYDIIHMQEALLPFPFLSAVFSSPQSKVILHNRGEFNVTGTSLQSCGQKLKKLAYRQVVAGNVDRIICNSRFTAQQTPMALKHHSKVSVLYNAINQEEIASVARKKSLLRRELRKELELPENAFLVSVVARLVEFKKIDRFITCFQDALDKAKMMTALIVGDGPLRDHLQESINNAGFADRIRMLGHRRDAKEIIASTDLFVLPSAGEAFGIAALEAVSLGIPAIVFSDAGGPLEFIENGKNGFIVSSESAMTDMLTRLACDQTFMQTVTAPCNIEQSAFDITYYVGRIREIYHEVLHASQ